MRSILIVSCVVMSVGFAALPFVGPADDAAAAPASVFAGSYVAGYIPGGTSPADDPGLPMAMEYVLSISASGKVAGTGSGGIYYGYRWTGEVSGNINDDGRLSIGGTETRYYGSDSNGDPVYRKVNFRAKAAIVQQPDGSLNGVEDDGTTFVWTLR